MAALYDAASVYLTDACLAVIFAGMISKLLVLGFATSDAASRRRAAVACSTQCSTEIGEPSVERLIIEGCTNVV